MNRRGFISSLAAFTATAVLDPERLLWLPGKKTIFVPPQRKYIYGIDPAGDAMTYIARAYMQNAVLYVDHECLLWSSDGLKRANALMATTDPATDLTIGLL